MLASLSTCVYTTPGVSRPNFIAIVLSDTAARPVSILAAAAKATHLAFRATIHVVSASHGGTSPLRGMQVVVERHAAPDPVAGEDGESVDAANSILAELGADRPDFIIVVGALARDFLIADAIAHVFGADRVLIALPGGVRSPLPGLRTVRAPDSWGPGSTQPVN